MLIVLEILLLGFFGAIAITQIILPIFAGKKLFPSFRTNPLKEKVEATSDMVETLKDQNDNLSKLSRLLAEKARLEKQITAYEPSEENTSDKK